jgi:hypothetical protein
MTEIKLKFLAWDVLQSTGKHITAKERQLANSVLLYFDPLFFVKSHEQQFRSLVKQDAINEKFHAESEKQYEKWAKIRKKQLEDKSK